MQTNIRSLDRELYIALRKRCIERGITVGAALAEAIRDWLDKERAEAPAKE